MASTALPWLWVIEALADVRDADIAILKAVITRVPDVLKDATEVVRERIALRYLDELAGKDATPSTSASAGGGGIDVDLSSEEVLCRYMREAGTLSTVEKVRVEPSYDLQQFILHKKASLPKCSLELLKDLVQEGHGQVVQLLEEQNSSGEPHGVVNLQCCNFVEHRSAKRLRWSSDEVLSQLLAKSPSVPDPDMETVSLREPIQEGNFQTQTSLEEHKLLTRSHQADNPQPSSAPDMETVSLREPIEEGHFQTVTSLEEHNLLTRSHQVDNPQPSSVREHQTGEKLRLNAVGLKTESLGTTSSAPAPAPAPEVGNAALQDHLKSTQLSSRNNDLETVVKDHIQKDTVTDGNIQLLEQNSVYHLAPLSGNQNNVNESVCGKDLVDAEPAEAPGDGEGHCVVPNSDVENLATGMHHLLGSQIAFSNDSMTGDWTEQSLCVKCEKGGQLLICSSCTIAVHEVCLGASVNLEETGLFLCPVCSYSRATIAYRKAKKKLSCAKKDLSAFLVRDSAHGRQKGQLRSTLLGQTSESNLSGELIDQTDQYEIVVSKAKEERQQSEAVGAIDKDKVSSINHEMQQCVGNNVPCSTMDIDHEVGVSNCKRAAVLPYHQQTDTVKNVVTGHVNGEGEITNGSEGFGTAEPQHFSTTHEIVVDGELHHKVDNACDTRNAHAAVKTKGDGEVETGDVCLRDEKHTLKQVRSVMDHDDNNTISQEGHAENKSEDAAPQKAHRSRGGSKEEPRKNSSPDKYSKRQARMKRYSNPILPYGRRARLPWTAEEEEALKEGVHKFAAEADRSLPWTKILEFGRHVFHKTRQPGDLKDKWRNIRLKEG